MYYVADRCVKNNVKYIGVADTSDNTISWVTMKTLKETVRDKGVQVKGVSWSTDGKMLVKIQDVDAMKIEGIMNIGVLSRVQFISQVKGKKVLHLKPFVQKCFADYVMLNQHMQDFDIFIPEGIHALTDSFIYPPYTNYRDYDKVRQPVDALVERGKQGMAKWYREGGRRIVIHIPSTCSATKVYAFRNLAHHMDSTFHRLRNNLFEDKDDYFYQHFPEMLPVDVTIKIVGGEHILRLSKDFDIYNGLGYEDFYFPNITEISAGTGTGHTSLKRVYLGNLLQNVGFESFRGIQTLEAVKIQQGFSAEALRGNYNFYDCNPNAIFYVPEGRTDLKAVLPPYAHIKYYK